MINIGCLIRFSVSFAFVGCLVLGAVSTDCLAQNSARERVKALYQEYRKLKEKGRHQEAVHYAKELVGAAKEAFGPGHAHVGLFLNNLADLYLALGDFAEAEPLYLRSLAVREKALGPDHPDVAQSLNNLAFLYYTHGDQEKALPLYRRSLEIMEKILGAGHPETAPILNNLADLYATMGNYDRAQKLYNKSIAINEKTFGRRHPGVASSLKGLGEVYLASGDIGKAAEVFKESLQILEAAFGPDHLRVTDSLDMLVSLHRELGDFTGAEVFGKRSLSIKEMALGANHPEVALSLKSLAILYYMMGDYVKSATCFKRSIEILVKAHGPEHARVAECLGDYAMLFHVVGKYDEAEAMLKRSLKIRKKVFGPEALDVALGLNNLGGLYKELGEYKKAERLYNQSLQIMELNFGKEHPFLAKFINNHAGFYLSFGQYTEAESAYKRSLQIKEKAFGPTNPSVALGLNNLGQVYKIIGNFTRAARLYQRSLEISLKALGPNHPQVAMTLNNLGIIYRAIGDYENADALYGRSLAINTAVFGPKHPNVALSLANIAELDMVRTRYDRAESAYKEALAIQKEAYGLEHPDVANSLNNLGLLYFAMGENSKAEVLLDQSMSLCKKVFGPQHHLLAGLMTNQALIQAAKGDFEKSHQLFEQANKIDDESIDQVIGFTSEEQKMRYLLMKNWSLYCFISLVQQHLFHDMRARIDALNVWLRRKGMILEAQKRYQEALVIAGDEEALKTLRNLSRVRTQLSTLVFAGPGKESLDIYNKRIQDLRSHKEELEAKLSRVSRRFALKKKKQKADCDKVARALPENTALIEFAKVKMYNFKAKGKEKKWNPAHYLAFILHARIGESVGLVDLGSADTIDKAVAELRGGISDMNETGVPDSCSKLYDLLFRPLKSELKGISEIFISPDANLNLIPFEVLKQPDGKYLIEDYTFNYLAAGRDLLGFEQDNGQGRKVLLIGDPDFDMIVEGKEPALKKPDLEGQQGGLLPGRSAEIRNFHFERLPGTREEVETIHALFGENRAMLYTGTKAVERVLTECHSPAIIHLATHGFFLEDLTLGPLPEDSPFRGMQTVQGIGIPELGKIKIDNPLLRSGIVLAGANDSLRSGDQRNNNGIVTANKIMGLNLQGTDMVVLSACDTGVGEVKTGEGVFGLRRAFTQAGARSMVMSMWPIPDQETKELMVAFYKFFLSGKMNRCQALRQAALAQMATVENRYGQRNPFYWGGFVFMGEAR